MDSKISEKIIYVDNANTLSQVVKSLNSCSLIAIDTEFVKISTLYPIVALIQLYDGENVYLVDPIKLESDLLEIFWQTLINSDAKFIFFAMHEDIELIYYYTKALPKNVCDLQMILPFIGLKGNQGLALVIKEFLNIELLKDQTTSVWLQRPLMPEQLRYGAEDVLYLIDLYNILYAKLKASQVESCYLSDIEYFRAKVFLDKDPNYEYLRYITDDMSITQKARLRDLVTYRQKVAEESNISLQLIISNKILHVLAVKACRNLKTLGLLGLHWKSVREYGEDILKIMNNKNINTDGIYLGKLYPTSDRSSVLAFNIESAFTYWAKEHNVSVTVCFTKRTVREWMGWYLSTEKDKLQLPLIEQSSWRKEIIKEVVSSYEQATS